MYSFITSPPLWYQRILESDQMLCSKAIPLPLAPIDIEVFSGLSTSSMKVNAPSLHKTFPKLKTILCYDMFPLHLPVLTLQTHKPMPVSINIE